VIAIAYQKLGQSDLIYVSKLSAEKSGREQAFSSQLSFRAHELLIIMDDKLQVSNDSFESSFGLGRLLGNYNLYMYTTLYLNLTYFCLDVSISVRDLRQKKLIQFFCHASDVTRQEIGRMCGSVCSCPHPGSLNAVPPFGYILPP